MRQSLLFVFMLAMMFFGQLQAQNNCLEFDGTDDYINCGNIGFGGTGATLEGWVYVDNFLGNSTHINTLFGREWDNANLLLRLGDGGTLSNDQVQFLIWTATSGYSLASTSALETDTWYHIAGVFDASAGMKIYINGVLDASLSTAGNLNSTSSQNFIIGSYNDGTARYFDGFMDEIRVWNDARTETEIRQNMYRELPNPSGEANLAAYYKLNETSGTTADDAKGSNDGTLTNYGSQSGYWQTSPAMFGPKNCLDFNGTNNWISTSAVLPSTYTKEAWVYIPSENNTSNNIISGGDSDGQHAFWIPVGYSHKLSAGHNGTWNAVQDPTTFPFDSWQHVALTYAANGTMTLYRNGVQVAQATGVAAFSGTAVRIGAFNNNQNLLGGKLDEVRIWNTARTASQIRDNMCRTLTGNESGLVAYYNFDNTSGTVLQDFSENGNDGTLNNMANSDWVASSAFNTWLNTSSSSWSTASNWSRGSAPSSTDNTGFYSYTGGTDATLSGTPTVNNMVLGSSSSMTLSSGLTVNGNLILESDQDLNGQTITLGTSAYLIEDAGRIYGNSGQIQTTRNLSNINENTGGLGAEITTSANMGSTTIIRTHAANADPASIERRYSISPTNNSGLNATLVFHYNNEELNGLTASSLELYRSTNNGTSWTDMNGSVNTFYNTITLSGIDAFSLWTAMESEEVNPPILETQNPVYDYAQNSPAIILAENATVTTSNNIDNATVSIAPIISGDELSVSNLPAGLSDNWDNDTKILTISGSGSAADYQTALRNVKFSTSASSEETRTIDFILGDGIGLMIDGEQHYYEVIDNGGSISWDNARSAALASRFGAAQGYLATITSSTENSYLAEKVTADTWIGASDSEIEGIWRWKDGPEAGTQFWQGDLNAGTSSTTNYGSAINGEYANWWTHEPNNAYGSTGEDCAHMYGSNSSQPGYWNDYYNNYSVQYYIIEYGGDGSDFTTIDYATVVVNGVSWTGSLDSDWATPDNWNNNAVPNLTTDIIIPDVTNDPVISSGTGANCKNLSVSPGGSLTIESGGSLITSGSISNSGSINIERSISKGQWHLISSPLTNAQSGIFDGDYLQSYDEENDSWVDITETNISLTSVKGYSLWSDGSGSKTVTFSGTPNTGDKSIYLTALGTGGVHNRANLIGNPYPSSIDWDLVSYEGAVYLYNGTAYESFTENKNIAPAQGFFIVPASSGNFSLTNACRTHDDAGTYYKGSELSKKGLILFASNGAYQDKLSILIDQSSSEKFEQALDAWKFMTASPGISQLWSVSSDGSLSIDTRPATETIQLGFTNNEAGTYAIGIWEIADISTAILEDTKLKIFHKLSDGDYSFDWSLNDDETRFKLHLNTTAVEDLSSSAVQVYVAGGNIIIQSEQQAQRITLTDITGRTLGVWDNKESIPAPATAGLYLVTVVSENQMLTKKIIIE